MRADETYAKLYHADTAEGFLDFREHADAVAPSLGIVRERDGKYELTILVTERDFPHVPSGMFGTYLNDYVHAIDTDLITEAFEDLPITGWLVLGYARRINRSQLDAGQRATDHPDAERVLCATYLDQKTGTLTTRAERPDGTVENNTLPEPAGGWTAGSGNVIAALQHLRATTT